MHGTHGIESVLTWPNYSLSCSNWIAHIREFTAPKTESLGCLLVRAIIAWTEMGILLIFVEIGDQELPPMARLCRTHASRSMWAHPRTALRENTSFRCQSYSFDLGMVNEIDWLGEIVVSALMLVCKLSWTFRDINRATLLASCSIWWVFFFLHHTLVAQEQIIWVEEIFLALYLILTYSEALTQLVLRWYGLPNLFWLIPEGPEIDLFAYSARWFELAHLSILENITAWRDQTFVYLRKICLVLHILLFRLHGGVQALSNAIGSCGIKALPIECGDIKTGISWWTCRNSSGWISRFNRAILSGRWNTFLH